MKRNAKVLTMTQLAILTALEAIVCFTPLGSIPMGGGIVATISHIPAIIGAVVLGWKAGVYLGALFGCFSFIVWTFMTPNPAVAFLFTPFYSLGEAQGNFWSLVIVFVPRILLGLFAALSYKGLMRILKNRAISAGIAGAVGSLTNTVLVLGMAWIFFGNVVAAGQPLGAFIITAAGVNGLLELVIAVAVSAALVVPLQKVLDRR